VIAILQQDLTTTTTTITKTTSKCAGEVYSEVYLISPYISTDLKRHNRGLLFIDKSIYNMPLPVSGLKLAEKVTAVTNALDGANSSWITLGLGSDGGGRRNNVVVKNVTKEDFMLHSYYLHWGKCRVPPNPVIHGQDGDAMLFINAGSWAATGSSGLVQWELPGREKENTQYLFFMWDAPFNFDYSNNFVGLWINDDSKRTSGSSLDIRDTNEGWQVYKEMYCDVSEADRKLGKTHDFPGEPKKASNYHLVNCGPGSKGVGKWGFREPCHVKNEKYEIKAIMGDRHEGETTIDIAYIQ